MPTNLLDRHQYFGVGLGYGSTGTRTAYALDTAFTLASAGKSLGVRFIAPTTTTITDVLFLVTAAPAGAHNLSVNACDSTSATQAGAALTNGTVAVSGGTSTNVWIKATFSTPPSVTEGTCYWIVIGDPSGAASNYSILSVTAMTGLINIAGQAASPISRAYTSSDGFATAGTGVTAPAPICIVFGDGKYLGNPYTLAGTADSSAAVERGWLITTEEDVNLSYIVGLTPAGSVKVYPAASAPGGTIFSGFNGGAAFAIPASSQACGCVRFPPCTLVGGAQYRVVIDPSASTTNPGYHSIEDDTTHSAILEACGFPGVSMMHTEESGGAWVDSPSKMPRLFLGFSRLPSVTRGVRPSLVGGSIPSAALW